MSDVLTLGDLARRFGVKDWQMRQLVDTGKLTPRGKVGVYRVFSEADVPAVQAALMKAGYLPEAVPEGQG